MNTILVNALGFVLIIAMGYFGKVIGIFPKGSHKIIGNIMMNITMPAAIICSFADMKIEIGMLYLVGLGILANVVTMAVGCILGRKKGREMMAYNLINYSGFKIGGFAFPYIELLLGAPGMVYACLFDVGNSLMSTGGTRAIAGIVSRKGNRKVTLKATVLDLLSVVPFDVYLIMLILTLFQYRFPDPVYSVLDICRAGNTMICMLMIGTAFDVHLTRNEIKDVLKDLVVRYALTCGLSLILYYCLPISMILKQVMILILLSPVSGLAILYTEDIGGNEVKSSVMNSLSIAVSIVLITSLITVWQ
jgi:predicted permease